MRLGKQSRGWRQAFTLVELLVVIAIIAVLVSLLTAGVMKTLIYVDQLNTVNDIRQLDVGVQSFKTRFGVYPPSLITLSNNPNMMSNADKMYVKAIWPRINFNSAGFDWSGGQGMPATVTLTGDQCLVYFLRGPLGQGWSKNPANPTQAVQNQAESRDGPYFDFPTNRLISVGASGNIFPSYQDGYKKNVYAFFSSGRAPNGFNPLGDCPNLGSSASNPPKVPPKPYFQKGTNPPRFFNSSTFQIISAGRDGVFGAGGPWAPASAVQDVIKMGPQNASNLTAGFDDLSNFHSEFLGVTGN